MVVPAPLAWSVVAGMGVERAHAKDGAHGLAGYCGLGIGPFENKEFVKIQERIGQQGLALEAGEVGSGAGGGSGFLKLGLEFIQPR